MTAAEDDCPVKWCHEAGEHSVHRRYLASVAVVGRRLILGVNVVGARAAERIEVTAVPRQGPATVIALRSDEATLIAESLIEGAERAGPVT